MSLYIAIMHYFFIMKIYDALLVLAISYHYHCYSFLDSLDFPTQHLYMKRQWNPFYNLNINTALHRVL